MLAFDEGEVFGRGEREARRQQPLRRRIAREIQEQRGALERAALLEAAAEELRAVVGHADAGEHDGEIAASPCRWRSRAWLAISTASRSCGRPPPEKIGSFWPRTRLFIRSSVVTPVSMKSRGTGARHRIDRQAFDAMRSRAAIGGPPSITWPTPLNTRPRMPGETPKVSGSPKKRTTVPGSASPDVDSSTSMVMKSSSMRRDAPQARATVAAAHLDRVVQADVERAPQEQQRTFQPRRRAFNREPHCRASFACSSSANSRSRSRLRAGEPRELVVADLLAHPLQRAQRWQLRDGVGMRRRRATARSRPGRRTSPSSRIIAACRCGRADAVDRRERRLPQERVVDEIGAEQRELLAHRQRVLADDARHALEVRLLVEQREEAAAQRPPFVVAVRGPPRRERRRVLGVRLQRMDGRIEARLRALDVERPEGLDVALGVAGHRLGEVARRRADRADHGDRARAAAQAYRRCAARS